jgi:hypothetical protein
LQFLIELAPDDLFQFDPPPADALDLSDAPAFLICGQRREATDAEGVPSSGDDAFRRDTPELGASLPFRRSASYRISSEEAFNSSTL